ncbi:MAG: NUDIX domain-containing protein, partial [Candidatus Sulfotelmatobacter sp.]
MTTATSSLDMNVILAAGGVLSRQTPAGGDEVLVVHRKRYGDWTLPKGKLKPGESFAAAALREVAEETGCRARFEDYL